MPSGYHQLINPRTLIDAASLNTAELLADIYVIPSNQREYAWKRDQIDQLISDLLEVAATLPATPDKRPRGHYMGAIVVTAAAEANTFRVLDGQQRLTSLLIFAAALMDHVVNIGISVDPFAEALRPLIGRFVGGQRRARIMLNYGQDFFEAFIVAPDSPLERELASSKFPNRSEVEELIAAAYERCADKLTTIDSTRLAPVRDALMELLVFLRIVVTDERMAFSLFETLNNRGADLSQADLVKNHLMKRATNVDGVAISWREVRDVVEGLPATISMTDMVHYSFISRRAYVQRESLLVHGYQKPELENTAGEVFMEEIKSDSLAAREILGRMGDWKSSRREIDDIVLFLKVNFALLPLVAADGAGWPPASRLKLARLIRNFTFRFLKVGNGSVGRFTKLMAELSLGIRGGMSLGEIAQRTRDHSPDDAFVEELKILTLKSAGEAFFALRCIEEKISAEAGIIAQQQSATQHLEHILPKRPALGDYSSFDEKERPSWLNRLGNLLILEGDKNKLASNRPIAEKLEIYSSSALKLPQDVVGFLQEGEWTPEAIRRRQEALAVKHADAWRLV